MVLNYNISFELSAIVFLVLLLFHLWLQYDLKNSVNYVFFKCVCLILCTNVFDIVTAITIDNYDMIDTLLNTLLNAIYMLTAVGSALYICYFTVVYAGEKEKYKRLTIVNLWLYGIYVAAQIINIFTGFLYHFDIGNGYVYTGWYVIHFILPLYYMLCAVFVYIRGLHHSSMKQKIVAMVYLCVAVSGSLLQLFVCQNILLSSYTPAIGLVLLLFFLESEDSHNKDEKRTDSQDIEYPEEERDENKPEEEESVEDKPEKNESVEEEMVFHVPQAKLLVVDDNRMSLDFVRRILKDTEMQIDSAQNGEEALKLLRVNTYHIVLLDHMMPVLDGMETLTIMKEEHLCDETPVIIISSDTDNRDEYLAAGFTDCLTEPVTGSQLMKLVYQYLPENMVSK